MGARFGSSAAAAAAALPTSVLGSDGVAGTNLTPSILVVGVGGGGCNAVNDMISRSLTGVDFLACNTDAQSLAGSRAHRKLHLGLSGLGAGASPRAGYDAAAHSYEDIIDELKGNNMVFLTAGMLIQNTKAKARQKKLRAPPPSNSHHHPHIPISTHPHPHTHPHIHTHNPPHTHTNIHTTTSGHTTDLLIREGMGGGTGTGASPVIAAAARELGILSVGIVTKPFPFEGGRRRRQAEEGISELEKYVDTLLVIPNENLLSLGRNITMENAFHAADGVLYEGIRGVTDLIVNPGLVNVDFADVTTVMANKGRALMGSGQADGDDRASVATGMALANPLLENVELSNAQGVLVCISGGDDLSLFDVSTTTESIRSAVHDDANIIFGSSYDPSLPEGAIRVSVMVTGLDPEFKQRVALAQQQDAPSPASAVESHVVSEGGERGAKPIDLEKVAPKAKSVWNFLKRHA